MNVGVFDSGLGGLTVVRALREHVPGLGIVYVADTAHAPYGDKSHAHIRRLSDAIARYLIDHHRIDALVVACNTATSAAATHLRAVFPDLPIVGTEPGIKPAMHHTRTQKIGILATPATLAGDKYQALADRLYRDSEPILFEQACPGLVEQIEAGHAAHPETEAMLEAWLAPMRASGVDTIVLGCTHYPLVSETIRTVMGSHVALIETGEAIARRLKTLLPVETDGATVSPLRVYATGAIDADAVRAILDDRTIRVEPVSIV